MSRKHHANNHKGGTIVRAKFGFRQYPILFNTVFDSYKDAVDRCKKAYPDMTQTREDIEKNFSIRSYTKAAMGKMMLEHIWLNMKDCGCKDLLVSMGVHAYPDLKITQSIKAKGCKRGVIEDCELPKEIA